MFGLRVSDALYLQRSCVTGVAEEKRCTTKYLLRTRQCVSALRHTESELKDLLCNTGESVTWQEQRRKKKGICAITELSLKGYW
jgi:hypothetical protein